MLEPCFVGVRWGHVTCFSQLNVSGSALDRSSVYSPRPGHPRAADAHVGIKSPVSLPQGRCPEPTVVYSVNSTENLVVVEAGGEELGEGLVACALPSPGLFLWGLSGPVLESWKVAHFSLSG